MNPSDLGKIIVIAGLAIAAVGLIIWLTGKFDLAFGRLPGDLRIERPGFSFRFPVVTCVILSIVITLILNALVWLFRK